MNIAATPRKERARATAPYTSSRDSNDRIAAINVTRDITKKTKSVVMSTSFTRY